MSKVGEYYRELSELGINPRDIRKKPAKKKAEKEVKKNESK